MLIMGPSIPPVETVFTGLRASNSAASVLDNVLLSALILLPVSSRSLSPMNLDDIIVSRTPIIKFSTCLSERIPKYSKGIYEQSTDPSPLDTWKVEN